MDCFILVDEPKTGIQNMSVDHQMLQYVADNNTALLRIYEWESPTVSLGYFQKYNSRSEHAPSEALGVVRRATGGGAIVHHHDLTYSIALPPSHFDDKIGAAQPLYDCLHDCVVDLLKNAGFPAFKWPEPTCRAESCSFLCFERRSLGDVLIRESKVMGSAQRRYKGALIQHGSLLLAKSPFAPSLDGLEELTEPHTDSCNPIKKMAFAESISSAISDFLGEGTARVDSFDKMLTPYPRGNFENAEWTQKR